MSYWAVPPEFSEDAVAILGCGPSLKGFCADTLRGVFRVIAINDSFLLAPWADILYFCDFSWWKEHRESVLKNFTGTRVCTLENTGIPGILSLRSTGETGLETDPSGIRHGCNSGYQCINLAYHLGAKRILLLGFDMRVVRGNLHWNIRPGKQTAEGFQHTLTHAMLPKFGTLREPLREAGVVVLNATPDSALKVWPYVPLEKVCWHADNSVFWREIAHQDEKVDYSHSTA